MSDFQINEAFDMLNLARGVAFDIVKERFQKLLARLDTNQVRKVEIERAFEMIKAHEEGKKSQAESHRAKFRSKSERDLDTELEKMAVKKPRVDPTEHATNGHNIKVTQPVAINDEKAKPAHQSSDAVLFEKVTIAFRDGSKFLRTLKLLDNMLCSPLVEQNPEEFKKLIFLAATTPENSEVPFSLSNKANRDALSQMVTHIDQIPINWNSAEEKDTFNRITRDRLDLFSDDAFAFNDGLKRLTIQAESPNPPSQLIGTLNILKSRDVVTTGAKLAACRKVTTSAFKNRQAFGDQASAIAAIQRDIHKI